jgi:hypothetical protein
MTPRFRFPLAVAAGLLAAVGTTAKSSVAASATAVPGYVRPVNEAGQPRPESYVFAEGRYFEGSSMDRSIGRMTFADITRILATGLAKQNYFPAENVGSAQLVIMVHWGTTEVYEDPNEIETAANLHSAAAAYQEAYAASGGIADSSALNAALMNAEMDAQLHASAEARNAALLGYRSALEKEEKNMMMSSEEMSMRFDLAQERYFVVLMAYDNQLRLREKKSKILWVTRLSVRSVGNDFTEALANLTSVGSDVFGKQVDSLLMVDPAAPRGTVTLGELKVIGPVGEPPAEDEDPKPEPER